MAKTAESLQAIGIMSGTSLDGVDVVHVSTDGEERYAFHAGAMLPFPIALRQALAQAALPDSQMNLSDYLRLEASYTQAIADAVNQFMHDQGLKPEALDVIGFHGQTLRHLPDEGLTLQMGNPSLLSARTGVAVVHDFRRRDMAEGGQGAPLVPLFHRLLLKDMAKPAAILNIGGVANISILNADGSVLAGDTGPGCGLLDAWVHTHTGQSFDKDGALALRGAIDARWVQEQIKTEAYYAKPLPKSADRYQFNNQLPQHLNVEDGAASLCALTAEAVAMSVKNSVEKMPALYVHGGGAHHPLMMQELQKRVQTPVQKVEALGLRTDTLEAECFAWLAVRRLKNKHLTLPETTGCRIPTVGGILTAK